MLLDDVYALTPLGESELRSSATRLSAAEIEVLVRIDGMLSLRQVMTGLSPESRLEFDRVLTDLSARRLVALAEVDPFTLTWRADMQKLAQAVKPAQADAGMASLQRSGFYVQIARERPPRPHRPGTRLVAVVVEDDPVLAKVTRTLLSLSGFDVRNAHNRAEVVAEIRRPPIPDLILLDVMLPDADGFDILQRVRQHPALKDVPVIMLTGKATREAVLKGLTGGADGYITKPFQPDALLRAVHTVLGLPHEGEGPAASAWKPAKPR
jgi:CheY-like chemotaxis protein